MGRMKKVFEDCYQEEMMEEEYFKKKYVEEKIEHLVEVIENNKKDDRDLLTD